MPTKEEILAQNDIGSGSLYFNRAKEAMDIWAKQQSLLFYKWMNETYIRYSTKNIKGYGTYKDGVPKIFYSINELYKKFELHQQSLKNT